MDGTGLRGGYDPSQHYLFTTIKFGARNRQDQERIAAYLEENLNGWLTWEKLYWGPSGSDGLWYATGKLEIPRLAEEVYGRENWLRMAEQHLLARDRARARPGKNKSASGTGTGNGTSPTAPDGNAATAATNEEGLLLWEGVIARRRDLEEYEQATGRKFYDPNLNNTNRHIAMSAITVSSATAGQTHDTQIETALSGLGLGLSAATAAAASTTPGGGGGGGDDSVEAAGAAANNNNSSIRRAEKEEMILNLYGEPIEASKNGLLYRLPYSEEYFCQLPFVPSIYSGDNDGEVEGFLTSLRSVLEQNENQKVGGAEREAFGTRSQSEAASAEETKQEINYVSDQIEQTLQRLKWQLRTFRELVFPESLSLSEPEPDDAQALKTADAGGSAVVTSHQHQHQREQEQLREELFYRLCRTAEILLTEGLPPLDPEKDGVLEVRLVKLPKPKLKSDGRE